jgi:hypothetical protein
MAQVFVDKFCESLFSIIYITTREASGLRMLILVATVMISRISRLDSRSKKDGDDDYCCC